jgi:TonB family protein
MLKFPLSFRFLCLLALSVSSILRAQSSEADLKARLMDKPLYLRGCWRDDKLHFDSAGQLLGKSGPVTFTLSGFDLLYLQLKKDKLILEGRRVGLELREGKQHRVPLNVGKGGYPEDESMHLEIAASPTGDYGPALDAIFVDDLSAFVPSLPFYWKAYGEKHFVVPGSPVTPSTSLATPSSPVSIVAAGANPVHIGGGVAPPKLLHSAEPVFSDAARGLKYSGKILINFRVTPEGKVVNMSLIRPAGLGLDEHALAAVQQYIFSPATMNGKPVLVELNVEVNFDIF